MWSTGNHFQMENNPFRSNAISRQTERGGDMVEALLTSHTPREQGNEGGRREGGSAQGRMDGEITSKGGGGEREGGRERGGGREDLLQ